MKFIVTWTTRAGGDIEDNLDSEESLTKAFSSWTPPESWTISEFVTRVDGTGGLLITETDDLASIAKAVAQYVAWLDYEVIPVLDIAEGVAIGSEGAAWARSAGGID